MRIAGELHDVAALDRLLDLGYPVDETGPGGAAREPGDVRLATATRCRPDPARPAFRCHAGRMGRARRTSGTGRPARPGRVSRMHRSTPSPDRRDCNGGGRHDLGLIESRTFKSNVVYVRYRVVR